MTRNIFLIIALAGISLFGGCKSKNAEKQGLANNAHEVKVNEFIHTTEYTYFRVTEGGREYWMAAPKRQAAKVGETLYYTTAWEMSDWKSPELDRTFDTVLFIQDLTDTRPDNTGLQPGSQQVHTGTPRQQVQQPVQKGPNMNGPAEPEGIVEEEISIHELINNAEKYANKLVTISGKVTKVNPAIMARNWVHITSEPDNGNNYDLTLTTQEEVKVDQLVTFQGQVSLNRDFGAGYTYKIIVENAKLTK